MKNQNKDNPHQIILSTLLLIYNTDWTQCNSTILLQRLLDTLYKAYCHKIGIEPNHKFFDEILK